MGSEWRDIAAVLRERPKTVPQKVIALREGISESLLSKYLKGDLAPEPALAIRIAIARGMAPEEFARLAGAAPLEASAGKVRQVRQGSDLEATVAAIAEQQRALVEQQRGVLGALAALTEALQKPPEEHSHRSQGRRG